MTNTCARSLRTGALTWSEEELARIATEETEELADLATPFPPE